MWQLNSQCCQINHLERDFTIHRSQTPILVGFLVLGFGFFCETESLYIVVAVLEFMILLPLPPESWD
jgi:hypothetical protein